MTSPYPASGEHAPLSGLDEFLVHNSPYPVRVMWTPDAQAYERVWFTCQDTVGELLLVIGLAFYPNLGTAEAFAIVNHRGRHTTVRAHRKLGTDRMDMTLGPFSFEVVEPFRQWRLRLDADAVAAATDATTGKAETAADNNDAGPAERVGFDITWLDTKRPVFRQLAAGMIVGGRAMSPIAGYDGFGRQEGWVEVDGDSSRAVGRHAPRHARPPLGHPRRRGRTRALHGHATPAQRRVGRVRGLRHLGRPRPLQPRRSARSAADAARAPAPHALRTRHPPAGGGRGRPRLRRRLGQDNDLRAAGPSDRLPALWHVRRAQRRHARRRPVARDGGGHRRRDRRAHGETFDVTDPAVRSRLAGQDQHHCRVECDGEVTYGLVEPYDTLCYEVSKAGVLGFSLLDG